MSKYRADLWVQTGIMIAAIVGLLCGFLSTLDQRYAKANIVDSQGESLKELKGEMDALYLRLIPDPEPIRHPGSVGR